MERRTRSPRNQLNWLPAALLAMTTVFAQFIHHAPAHAMDPAGLAFVSKLQTYEKQAFRDYEFRHNGEAVINRSNELWDYHLELRQSGFARPCASAVRVLSHMISGAYYASKRSEIPLDWFHFAPQYGELRLACLEALNAPAGSYTLPSSFTR